MATIADMNVATAMVQRLVLPKGELGSAIIEGMESELTKHSVANENIRKALNSVKYNFDKGLVGGYGEDLNSYMDNHMTQDIYLMQQRQKIQDELDEQIKKTREQEQENFQRKLKEIDDAKKAYEEAEKKRLEITKKIEEKIIEEQTKRGDKYRELAEYLKENSKWGRRGVLSKQESSEIRLKGDSLLTNILGNVDLSVLGEAGDEIGKLKQHLETLVNDPTSSGESIKIVLDDLLSNLNDAPKKIDQLNAEINGLVEDLKNDKISKERREEIQKQLDEKTKERIELEKIANKSLEKFGRSFRDNEMTKIFGGRRGFLSNLGTRFDEEMTKALKPMTDYFSNIGNRVFDKIFGAIFNPIGKLTSAIFGPSKQEMKDNMPENVQLLADNDEERMRKEKEKELEEKYGVNLENLRWSKIFDLWGTKGIFGVLKQLLIASRIGSIMNFISNVLGKLLSGGLSIVSFLGEAGLVAMAGIFGYQLGTYIYDKFGTNILDGIDKLKEKLGLAPKQYNTNAGQKGREYFNQVIADDNNTIEAKREMLTQVGKILNNDIKGKSSEDAIKILQKERAFHVENIKGKEEGDVERIAGKVYIEEIDKKIEMIKSGNLMPETIGVPGKNGRPESSNVDVSEVQSTPQNNEKANTVDDITKQQQELSQQQNQQSTAVVNTGGNSTVINNNNTTVQKQDLNVDNPFGKNYDWGGHFAFVS